MEKIKEFSKKQSQKNGPVGKKTSPKKTERAMGVGRRTREEIVKWSQMTALRFQRGKRHQTPPASLQGTKQWHSDDQRKHK